MLSKYVPIVCFYVLALSLAELASKQVRQSLLAEIASLRNELQRHDAQRRSEVSALTEERNRLLQEKAARERAPEPVKPPAAAAAPRAVPYVSL